MKNHFYTGDRHEFKTDQLYVCGRRQELNPHSLTGSRLFSYACASALGSGSSPHLSPLTHQNLRSPRSPTVRMRSMTQNRRSSLVGCKRSFSNPKRRLSDRVFYLSPRCMPFTKNPKPATNLVTPNIEFLGTRWIRDNRSSSTLIMRRV